MTLRGCAASLLHAQTAPIRFAERAAQVKPMLGRMDTTQVTLIHQILAAADERNLPLWIGGGWAIDAR
ncbi:nucleotidyltransferase domain-containing protein, partial [Pseudomonas aeruginosa]